MVAFARRSTATYSGHEEFDPDEAFAFGELSPGERVCPPPHRSRIAAALRGIVFIMIVGIAICVMFVDRASWPWWLRAAVDQSISMVEQARSELNERAESAVERAESPLGAPEAQAALDERPAFVSEPLPPSDTAAVEPPVEAESVDVVTLNATETSQADETAALPGTADDADDAESERLPPPVVDPDDPYQRRAASVGLHPGLSRVLLERMTEADYRNAGIAIQKALQNTDNDAVVIWPRQRKPELALFRVRFVPGAAPGCRRYVVTITKDGWTTTALPMENCGSQTASLRQR